MIIVAKYKENIDPWWINYDHIVYDKSDDPIPGSISLSNVGREADTYLHHIIEHYEHLDNQLIFTQADPFAHTYSLDKKQFRIDFLHHVHDEFDKYTGLTQDGSDKTYDNQLPMVKFYWDLFEEEPPADMIFTVGAIFAVPRSAVLARPKSFYQKALEMNLDNKYSVPTSYIEYYRQATGPWIMERLWRTIFMS